MKMRVEMRQVSAFAVSVGLHLLLVTVMTWLASRPASYSAASRAATATAAAAARTALASRPRSRPMVIVSQAPASASNSDSSRAAARPAPALADPTPADLGIHVDERSATLRFTSFTFDAAKIISRAGSLYPYLTRTFSFDRVTADPRDPKRTRDSLINPFAAARTKANADKPPLDLTDAQLQALIDKAWSRRHRWQGFQAIADLTSVYNANDGRIPMLLRTYVDQNALQPYADRGSRDPRLWTQLGLTADHTDFVNFVSRYATEHPSTRATTELLFLLEKQAEASLDTLVTLVDINPERDLRWTREINADAFNAIVAIRRYYIAQLARRGFTTRASLTAHYDKTRIEILTSILRITPDGYRANDARFLIGAIYWRSGKRDEAMRAWTELRVDPRDRYATVSSEIVEALRASGGAVESLDVRRINRALDAEQARWVSFSYDRLRQFGYRFDTF